MQNNAAATKINQTFLANSKVSIKPEIQRVIDADDECVDKIMGALYNSPKIGKYHAGLGLKKDDGEGVLMDSPGHIIDFDAMGIKDEDLHCSNTDSFLVGFGISKSE